MFPKARILRSEPYRRYVAKHACFACGTEGRSQAAHANRSKGMALKACDSATFPLCSTSPGRVGCHAQFDLCIDMSRDERRELEDRYVERMHTLAANDGWILGPTEIRRIS